MVLLVDSVPRPVRGTGRQSSLVHLCKSSVLKYNKAHEMRQELIFYYTEGAGATRRYGACDSLDEALDKRQLSVIIKHRCSLLMEAAYDLGECYYSTG